MFTREIIQRYSTEECENKLAFIGFIFRTTKDPEVLVRFKLYKNRIQNRLNALNPHLKNNDFFITGPISESLTNHFAGFYLPRMKW